MAADPLMHYIFDANGNPVPEPDLMKFAAWFETAARHLREDRIGEVRVSTVFLGLNHQFGDGPPVLWETMIFGGKHNEYQERYTSREEALAGHERALALVREDG